MVVPELGDLAAFAAVAQARSFRGAALLRGGSASGLSDAVRRAETQLGVRLLNRTTRSVTLTEAGERLLARLKPALGEVAAAVETLAADPDQPAGTLRLNVPTIVARAILPRILGPFLAAHPGISVEAVADDSFIDVLAAGFDAGVRYEERLEKDMIAVPIGPRTQRYAAAAAPGYLRSRGRPEHPRDLLQHACIRHRFVSGITYSWEFERAGEVIRIVPSGPLLSNTLDIEVQAAVDGVGIIGTFEDVLAPGLASGLLEPVLPNWWQSFSGPFLYYPSRRHMPTPLRAFVDFIRRTPFPG